MPEGYFILADAGPSGYFILCAALMVVLQLVGAGVRNCRLANGVRQSGNRNLDRLARARRLGRVVPYYDDPL